MGWATAKRRASRFGQTGSVFGSKISLARSKRAGSTKAFPANSLLNGTGNINHRTGNSFGGTGNFQGEAGNLSKPHFCSRGSLSRRRGSAPQAAGTPRSTYCRSLSTLPSTSIGCIKRYDPSWKWLEAAPSGALPQFGRPVSYLASGKGQPLRMRSTGLSPGCGARRTGSFDGSGDRKRPTVPD